MDHDKHKNHDHENHDHEENHEHQENHNHKKSHDHHEGHDHHGHVEMFRKRFWVSLIFMVPILLLSPMIQDFLGIDLQFTFDLYVLALLSTFVYFYGGWPFLSGVVDEVKDRKPGMMTLIAMAITVAYVYSTAVVLGFDGHDMYWELSTLIVIMLLGHWIEMKSVHGASNALEELIKIMPNEANLVDESGEIKVVKVSDLSPGDRVLVKAGEKIPVDGTILKGSSNIDESSVTGESVPVEKSENDQVIGGSVNNDQTIEVEVEKLGEDSYLSQVVKLVEDAQASKSKTQNLANRAAAWLFYIAVVAGIATFSAWMVAGFGVDFSIVRMVTVMIIACPHALGLAIPLVNAVTTSKSAKEGLLIRNRTAFEDGRRIDTLVFDKTGTLTKGEFGITDMSLTDNEEDLILAASLESYSEHPIAQGIYQAALDKGYKIATPEDVDIIKGRGLSGTVKGKEVKVVSPGYMDEYQLENPDNSAFETWSDEGKTVVFVLIDDEVRGMIALADQIRDSAFEVVGELKKLNIEPVMLTGDNERVANWVAGQIGIDRVFAEVLPHEKSEYVESLQKEGKRVGMTGDGINDAPALAQADLGIAIGTGTDVAIETADIVLVRSEPRDVLALIDLSKKSYRKMVQNLWWATGYNIVALPLAAGVL